ncbi:MAG: hypothetical protein ACKO3W_10220, partial [bacterium]
MDIAPLQVAAETPASPGIAAALLLTVLLGVPASAALAVRAIGRRSWHGDAVVGWLRIVAVLYVRFFHRLRIE